MAIPDAILQEFMTRLPKVFPPGHGWDNPNVDSGAVEEIASLVAADPRFTLVADALVATHPDVFAEASASLERFRKMTRFGTLVGAARLFEELPDGEAPPIAQLIKSRAKIVMPEDEPDAYLNDRPFVSDTLALERDRALDMSMQHVATTRPLNVTDLRNDGLAGLAAVFMNQPVRGFRRIFAKDRTVSAQRVDADFFYRGDFPYLRSILTNRTQISYCFNRPINLAKLAALLKDQHVPFTVDGDDDGNRIDVSLGERPIFTASPYNITITVARLSDGAKNLEEALNIATRVIEGIHHDEMFSAESQIVQMRQLKIFIDALFGFQPSSIFQDLGKFLSGVREMEDSKRYEYFSETRNSAVVRQAARREGHIIPPAKLMLKREAVSYPPHVKYVIFEDKWPHEIVIGFDLNLEIDQFEEAAESLGLVVQEIENRSWHQVGSGHKRASKAWNVYSGDDTEAEGKPLMKFGRKSVSFSLLQGEKRLGQATALLDALFDKGAFVTSTIKDRIFDAGLTPDEMGLLDVWNLFRSLYNIFVHIGLEQEIAERVFHENKPMQNPPSAEDWILGKLKESPDSRPEARLLHTLQAVKSTIREEKLSLYGPRAEVLYGDLNTRIDVLSTVVNPAAPMPGHLGMPGPGVPMMPMLL